jgi:transposase, IS6 family
LIRPECRFSRSREWIPRVINTDKNPAYGEAIAELKRDGLLPKGTQHRQVKYLNSWRAPTAS